MRLRQSTLKVYNACPLQAYLNETTTSVSQANAKAVFGTVVHYSLDKYHNGTPIDECINIFKELWNDPERITQKPEVWPKGMSYGGLRQQGIDILKSYDKRNRWENRTILASEHRFLVPFGDHELEGTVDFVEVKKDGRGRRTLNISDLKTTSRQPTIAELKLDLQFTVYCFASLQREFWVGNGPDYPPILNGAALFEDLKDVPRRGVWFHLMGSRELDAGERDDDDFMRLYRLVTEIERAWQAKVFVPHIGDACTFCSHKEHCNIKIPSRDELALEML